MGYYLQIDLRDAEPLALLIGWRDVRNWIYALPIRESTHLRHFAQYGWEDEVDALKDQLSQAIKAHPAAAETTSTLTNWLALLNAVNHIVVVTITDGLGEGGGESDTGAEPGGGATKSAIAARWRDRNRDRIAER